MIKDEVSHFHPPPLKESEKKALFDLYRITIKADGNFPLNTFTEDVYTERLREDVKKAVMSVLYEWCDKPRVEVVIR